MRLSSTSDTEVICALIAQHEGDLGEAAAAAMARIRGAFSAVVLSEDTLLGFRDPDGIRPLVLGDLDGRSRPGLRDPALDIVGASFVKELGPGELVICDADGVRIEQAVAPRRDGETMCVFEHIYFARPDASMDGQAAARLARADGHDARVGGARQRRHRDRGARLGHARGDRLRAGVAGSRSPRA